jgi:hypothetical protein
MLPPAGNFCRLLYGPLTMPPESGRAKVDSCRQSALGSFSIASFSAKSLPEDALSPDLRA